MGRISKISWTDGSLNFWEGCTKVSPACLHCYAETRDLRYHKGEHWGKGQPRKKSKSAIQNIRRLNGLVEKGGFVRCECGISRWSTDECCGSVSTKIARPTFFLISLGDFFDEEVPLEWLAEAVIEVMKADSMDFMILTKRIETALARLALSTTVMTPAWRERVLAWTEGSDQPGNIAIGTTIENLTVARPRLDALVNFPAVRTFVSGEPLLGAWGHILDGYSSMIDLVIAGGESGTQARPMHPKWVQEMERFCDENGIPFHFKQWGEWIPTEVMGIADGKSLDGNLIRVGTDGKVFAYDSREGAGHARVWRAGVKTAGHQLDATGRTRTERLAFPLQPWKYDWVEMSGHPLAPAGRKFHSAKAAEEFLAANPYQAAVIRAF